MDYFEYLRAIRSSDLSSNARIVALIIASYNPSRPSNKQIAEGTGLSVRSVIRAKSDLVSQGYLVSHRHWDMPNSYIASVTESLPSVTESLPSDTQSLEGCQVGNLNTNINTKENTNKYKDNNDDSNESSLVNSFKEKDPEELITLDTNEIITTGDLVDELAEGPAALSAKKVEEHRLLKLAEELWG